MDFLNSPSTVNMLSSMLEESSKSAQESEIVAPKQLAPTNIVHSTERKPEVNNKAIWSDSEIPSEDALQDLDDKRPCPKYEICYKQTVGTEDTFLGLGDQTPASFDCNEIVVKVHFPGSTMKDLDLDVTKNRIRAESKTLKLFTYLPVTVDPDKGSAKFDTKKEMLIVVLPIENDL